MRLTWVLPALLAGLTHALVTFDTMRNLTAITEEVLEQIVGLDGIARSAPDRQVVMLKGEDNDRSEAEDTISAALRVLCSALLVELEKPLDEVPPKKPKCRTVIKEYHDFLAATAKLLREVREREERWRWGAESPVFEGLGWWQGLWASRRANKQERSFIEQQLVLYEYRQPSSCWGMDNEVLKRDVEVVEVMNDLIDFFE